MTQHADQLRDAFETHEGLAPDAGAVYARVQQLAKKHKRRRRGAQIAGGAVLGAGLIAAGINLPGLIPGSASTNHPDPNNQLAAGSAPKPVASSVVVPGTIKEPEFSKDLSAYFGAGYGYNDAVTLAKIWKSKAPIGNVKAEAGALLRAGQTLPITPHKDPEPPVSKPDPQLEKDLDAYFHAGYVWDDAVRLAKLWHLSDPSDAKIKAGKELLEGKKLPFKPKPANVTAERKQEKELAQLKNQPGKPVTSKP